jgi:hypothetical protein
MTNKSHATHLVVERNQIKIQVKYLALTAGENPNKKNITCSFNRSARKASSLSKNKL